VLATDVLIFKLARYLEADALSGMQITCIYAPTVLTPLMDHVDFTVPSNVDLFTAGFIGGGMYLDRNGGWIFEGFNQPWAQGNTGPLPAPIVGWYADSTGGSMFGNLIGAVLLDEPAVLNDPFFDLLLMDPQACIRLTPYSISTVQ
jgi:hypothetical protein